jgi:hypothetical protein
METDTMEDTNTSDETRSNPGGEWTLADQLREAGARLTMLKRKEAEVSA